MMERWWNEFSNIN